MARFEFFPDSQFEVNMSDDGSSVPPIKGAEVAENGHLILTLGYGGQIDAGQVLGPPYTLTDADKQSIAQLVLESIKSFGSYDQPDNVLWVQMQKDKAGEGETNYSTTDIRRALGEGKTVIVTNFPRDGDTIDRYYLTDIYGDEAVFVSTTNPRPYDDYMMFNVVVIDANKHYKKDYVKLQRIP